MYTHGTDTHSAVPFHFVGERPPFLVENTGPERKHLASSRNAI